MNSLLKKRKNFGWTLICEYFDTLIRDLLDQTKSDNFGIKWGKKCYSGDSYCVCYFIILHEKCFASDWRLKLF